MSAGVSGRKPVEITSLTTLRGGLASWVVLYHFWNDVLTLFPAAEALSPFVRKGHMAVPAFFMLSGFVLTYNYASQFRHLRGAPVSYELGLVVPTFITGVAVCWMHWGFQRAAGATARWAGIALCAGVVTCCFAPSEELVIALLLCLFFGLIIALAWAGNECHFVWKVKPFAFLGEVSYSLYMTHTLAQKLISARLASSLFAKAPVLERVGVLTCYALLVTACCLSSYFLVEKPCRKWLRRSRHGGNAARDAPAASMDEPEKCFAGAK